VVRLHLPKRKTHPRHDTRTSLAEFKNASVCRTDADSVTVHSDEWVLSPTVAEAKLTASDSSKSAQSASSERLPVPDDMVAEAKRRRDSKPALHRTWPAVEVSRYNHGHLGGLAR